jgi:hypothetical protein
MIPIGIETDFFVEKEQKKQIRTFFNFEKSSENRAAKWLSGQA